MSDQTLLQKDGLQEESNTELEEIVVGQEQLDQVAVVEALIEVLE